MRTFVKEIRKKYNADNGDFLHDDYFFVLKDGDTVLAEYNVNIAEKDNEISAIVIMTNMINGFGGFPITNSELASFRNDDWVEVRIDEEVPGFEY
jgi:hypothetical protein